MSSPSKVTKQRAIRRKKHPKVFCGSLKAVSRREASPEATIPVPTPVVTTSGKKLALSKPGSSSAEHSVSSRATDGACSPDFLPEMKGLRLIDLECLLASITRRASCSVCGSQLTVREDLKTRRELCTKLTLSCTNELCSGSDDTFSDPYKHSKALNSRSVLAGRLSGRGRAGLLTFCGVMGLPPPLSPGCYSEHNHMLHKIVQDLGVESFRTASTQLHRLQGADPDAVVDVTVTCDGTWSKRGFTATYCVVVVMAWETGQVLDAIVLGKRCNSCKEKEEMMGKDSEEFLEWMEEHQDSCNSNYSGSSCNMETEGTARIWLRSVERNRLRYMEVISDGDTKSVDHLNKDIKPYGRDVVIEKLECVSHVQKRVGTRLRKLKKDTQKDKDGRVIKLNWSGRGRFTDKNIDKLQVYYGGAIRSDVDAMEKSIWAIYHHSISTDDDHNHSFCPSEPESWCKHNRAIARGESVPRHTPIIPHDLGQYVKPTFTALSKRTLLEKCVLGATQNQNESLNSIIWSRCPKTGFCSRVTVEVALYLAVLTFCLSPLFQRLLGSPPDAFTAEYLASQDANRILKAEQKAEDTIQRRRKFLRSGNLAMEEEHIASEGITYAAGAF